MENLSKDTPEVIQQLILLTTFRSMVYNMDCGIKIGNYYDVKIAKYICGIFTDENKIQSK